MCIFHIKQTWLASVFASICTFPSLFFFFFLNHNKIFMHSNYKEISKKEDWKTPRLPQQWYPFWACGSGYSEHRRAYHITDKVLHGYNIHIVTRTPPPRGRSARPNLRAQGSDGLFGGCRYQTTFTLVYPHPLASETSLEQVLWLCCTFLDIKIQ